MSRERRKPGRRAPVAPSSGLGDNTHPPHSGKTTTNNRRDGGGRASHRYSHLLEEMVGCGDMVLLEPLSEETLVENLRTRYQNGEIYVSSCSERKGEGERDSLREREG